MIRLGRVVLVFGLDEAHGLVDRHRRQLYPVGDVAQRKDVRHIRARIIINDDRAPRIQLHAGIFQTQTLGVRIAAKRQHDQADMQRAALLGTGHETIGTILADFLDDIFENDADALGLHRLMQALAHVVIEPRKDFLAAIDQRRFNTESVEDIGEFHGDITAAGNQDRFRQFFQIKRFVGRDRQLMAGQRLVLVRRAADRNNDTLGCEGLTGFCELHGMGIDQFGTTVENIGLGVLQPLAIQPLETGNFLVLRGDQLLPVEAALAHTPAETFGILEMFGELRGIDEQLLRHAAANDAGAAITIFFSNPHALAERGRHAAAAHAARAATDDEKIVVISCHSQNP